jgi:hypothetical protein
VKDVYVCAEAWALPVGEAETAGEPAARLEPGTTFGGGFWIGCRNVPLMTWPLMVTAATLSCFACTRKAEYGISTEVLAIGANRTNAFQTSSATKIPHQTRPGRLRRGGVSDGPPCPGVGGAGGDGKLKTTLRRFAGGLGYDR